MHRSRLFAKHLPSFGWEPIVLTVDEKYYEEAPDHILEQLLPATLRIEKVTAFKVTRPRLIGDIGLRAFIQLFKGAKKIICREHIDFIYITIPSFYTALLGRWLHQRTGIPYGIDYIDPWVHEFPGSKKTFSRHWWSTKLSRILEPVALKKASLVTGVAEGYYEGVIERNPHLKQTCLFGAMPYGGEPADHAAVANMKEIKRLFVKDPTKFQFVYAGAMLPKAYIPLEKIMQAIANEPENFKDIQFHFIGTGKRPDDPASFNIKPMAQRYGLWQSVIFEYPMRIPYLDVLVHLKDAGGIFILGSTEPHYTPSKIYQGVLSRRPVLGVLHKDSTAGQVIRQSGVGMVLSFDGDEPDVIRSEFATVCCQFSKFAATYDQSKTNQEAFEKYTAGNTTKELASLINQVLVEELSKAK